MGAYFLLWSSTALIQAKVSWAFGTLMWKIYGSFLGSKEIPKMCESHLQNLSPISPLAVTICSEMLFSSTLIYLQLAAANYNPSFTFLSFPSGSSINQQNFHSEPIMCKTLFVICKENRECTKGTEGNCYLCILYKTMWIATLLFISSVNSDFLLSAFPKEVPMCTEHPI
jgi:hypothetical protein